MPAVPSVMPAVPSVMPAAPFVIPDIFNRESKAFFLGGGDTKEETENKTGFPLKTCGNDSWV